MTPIWLETPRLALRRFTPADLDWVADLYADADFTRYLGGIKSRAQVEQMFSTRILDYYDTHPGFGIWATVDRSTGERLGFHLLNCPYGETFIQLGFGLAHGAQGRGLATEMATAVLRYGFVDLGLDRIAGIASRDNVASLRVLEKSGLERRGERALTHPAYAADSPLAFFERERDAWIAR